MTLPRVFAGAGATLLLVIVLLVVTGRIAPATCTTTKGVVARTAPALERGFEIADLQMSCDPTGSESTIADITLTRATAYGSRLQLATAVGAALAAAGWTPRYEPTSDGIRDLGFRDGYTASVRIMRIAPPLATIAISGPKQGLDPGLWRIAGERQEHSMSSAQRLRFLTFTAFLPRFVPRGFDAWDLTVSPDLDVAQSDLTVTGGLTPSLRSEALPPDYDPRRCDTLNIAPTNEDCRRWGTTPAGIAVYIPRDRAQPDRLGRSPAAVVGDTLVTLLDGHDAGARPPISRADVLRIFGSLRPLNTPAR